MGDLFERTPGGPAAAQTTSRPKEVFGKANLKQFRKEFL